MTTYVDFDGATLAQSATPTVTKVTTAAGQSLTGTTGVNNQLTDKFGGAPTLIGGGASDTFSIVDSNTTVIEAAGGGVDTVNAWCNFILPANIEDLTLEAAGVTGTGNALNNLMIALGAKDTLVAGTGEDVLVDGGAGGDTFSFGVQSYHDVIVGFQTSGANHDVINLSNLGYTSFGQVQSHLTQVGADTLLTLPGTTQILIKGVKTTALTASDFTLPTSVNHPSSIYANYSGATMFLSGAPTAWLATTKSGQTLTGTAGSNNQLGDQIGGAPTFVVQGGGDNTFCIMDPNTKIIVPVNTGVDTVQAWCNYAMADNLKNLTLENNNISGVANGLGDLITALGQYDTLIGGTGLDVLVDAGPGNDTFAFNVGGNHDVVYGFRTGGVTHDVLQVSNFGYSTFAQVQSKLSQVGADTLLTLSSTDSVLIKNTQVSALTASDFALATAPTAMTATAASATVSVVKSTGATASHPLSGYTNYSGQAMYLSTAATAWLSTTNKGQSLSAGTSATPTQFSDQHGGATLTAGAGDNIFCIVTANTTIIDNSTTAVDTVAAWCSYTMAANLRDLQLKIDNVTGTANNLGDLIIAYGSGDTLVGGTGQDVLVDKGAGGETFVFNTAGNHDVVVGFQASGYNHDVLQVSNFGISSFAQVQADLTQVGADTLLTLSSTDSVLIRNTTVSSLTFGDFALAAATSAVTTTPVVTTLPVTTSVTITPAPANEGNYAGSAMHLSAAPTAWLATTAAGQTLTGPSTGAAQLGDQFGGAPTLIAGAGDTTFSIMDPNTKIVVSSTTSTNTVLAWCDYTLPANVQDLTLETAHSTGVGNTLGNLLIANGANDTLVGGAGSDVMVDGGGGSDVFSFSQGGGHDAVVGFQTSGANHDFIQLSNYGFTSFSQVQSHLSQVGADTLLTLSGGDAVLIRNTTVASLNASDFLLQLDTSKMTMTFDGEFNSLSLYNPATGQGLFKTSFSSGTQSNSGATAYTSHTLVDNKEQEIYVDPSYQGTGTAPLGLNPFSISNGILTITGTTAPSADVSSLSGYQYTSGLLTTAKSFSQLYGYFEIKAELPTGQGAWPAFWLLPSNGAWPPEIDALEQVGGDKIYQTTHTDQTGSPTAIGFTTDLSNVSNTFHTYGVLWTAQNIDYYIDGVEVASMATPSDANTPMYMLVNLALGGTFPGNVPTNFTSAQLKIAYIHAYSLNSSQASAVASSGNDTVYVTQSAADTLPASADIVQSGYTYSLAGTGAHTLQLTGSGNINAIGNNLGDNISGNAGNNTLTGGTGNDTITAGSGNDTLSGHGGTDTFVFNVSVGKDVITDFSGHDILDISSFLKAGYTPTLSDSGANTTLTFSNGASIELLGVHAASLISTAVGYTH